MNQRSLPKSKHEDQQLAALVQDQEDIKKVKEDIIVQILMRARKEWEAFHHQHPDIDEETFCQAQRFCVKQWLLQGGIVLSDLPAFERAQDHFAFEVIERATEIEVTTLMMKDPFPMVRSLAAPIAAQAQLRSKRLREVIGELSSKKGSYLAGKVDRLRAPGQARDREKEAQERANMVRQDIETIKAVGIAIAYEREKVKLKGREQEVVEQLNYAHQLMQDSRRLADAAADVTRFKAHIRKIDTLLEDLHFKTRDMYRVQDVAESVLSDGDAATQRAKDAQDLLQTFGGLMGGIQKGIADALEKAKAQIEQAARTEGYTRKVKHTLEQTCKRSAGIEKWAEQEKQQAEARKKMMQDLRTHVVTDEAELESICQQGKRRAEVPPDPTRLGTGAGPDAFQCAERFVQAKAVDTVIRQEEKLRQAIEIARSKTKEATDQLKRIYAYFNELKALQLKIAQKLTICAKYLEKGKQALEQAARAVEISTKDAKDAQDQHPMALPDRGEDTAHAQGQARPTAQEEMEAYSQVKISLEYAIRYLRDIASEQRKVKNILKTVMKDFTDLRQGYLSFEKYVLDGAITGVKNIVKASFNLIRLEEHAEEAARQAANALDLAIGANSAQLLASEQEALLLAAFANDSLAGYAAGYGVFHKLAVDVAKETLATQLATSREHLVEALDVVKNDVDEMKQEKESKAAERQTAASAVSADTGRQAHLLIDERTGAITLKERDRGAAFHLQDLAGISEASTQEDLHHSCLLFKDPSAWSSHDVAHDLLHESCETRTRIHLQVPDGTGEHVAMLFLPNGTQIKVADIDVSQTEYDPTRPECGVTITLKKGGNKINLLAAASVMRELTPEVLLDLIDKSLDENINQIKDAVRTRSIEAIGEAFEDARLDERNRTYLERCILSSQKAEERFKEHIEWVESICSAVEQIISTLREYGYEALKEENGEKEITDVITLENFLLDNMHDEMYQKRDVCLQKIAREKGLDRVINCQFFANPHDDATATNLRPNGEDLLDEYERARSWQLAEQGQDRAEGSPSDTWSSYLARLRRAILDEAPPYFRTAFLVYRIREAIETENVEEGTEDDPGVSRLAQELARGSSAMDGQGSAGEDDYARALHIFTQRVVAGMQKTVETADPCEIFSRVGILDFVYRVIEYTEAKIGYALDRMTPTVGARLIVGQIGQGGSAVRK